MKTFKCVGTYVLALILTFMLTACGQDEPVQTATSEANGGSETAVSSELVEISILNTKNDINDQMIAAAAEFSKTYPNISINVLSTDKSPVEKASTLYATGTPATLCMLDSGDMTRFVDKALDLSNEPWVNDLAQKEMVDGKVIGFPFAVEGYGFIYNQEVLDKAVGGTFDPSTINTQDALEELFIKIEESGAKALAIGSMDWSLGNHFLAISYATQGDMDVNGILGQLKSGESYANNAAFNGLLDTFDIMKNYNMAKDDPMAYDYAESLGPVARGEAGISFNGNWAILELQKSNPEGDFGFMPVPTSNDASLASNNAIAIGATKQIFIDGEMSSQAEQDAAKKFLEWLVYHEDGQNFMVNESNIVMGFTNVEITPASPLAKDLIEYNNAGKSIAFAGNYVPADHWSVLGASMQKYLVDMIDRDEVAAEIEAYWQGVE